MGSLRSWFVRQLRALGLLCLGCVIFRSALVPQVAGEEPPTFSSQPLDQTVAEHRAVVFTAYASGGPWPEYQWLFESTPIPNATDWSLTLPAVSWADAGRYSVVASNSAGSVTSVVAVLTVVPSPTGVGSLDLGFRQDADRPIQTMVVQPDGGVVLGGAFTTIAGVPRRFVARLLPNGTLDPSFDVGDGPDAPVKSLALTAAGEVLIAGTFRSVNGWSRRWVAKLRAGGSLDTNFVAVIPSSALTTPFGFPPRNSSVEAIGVQKSGHIVLVGHDNVLLRLRPDGMVDRDDLSILTFNGGTH